MASLTRKIMLGSILGLGGLGLSLVVLAKAQEPVQKAVAAADPIIETAKGEHPMFGGTPDRNMANKAEKFGPAQLLPVLEDDKVVKPTDATLKWKQILGSRSYGGPTIAGGKVFVGTNNEHPRNPRDTRKNADGDVAPVDKGVIMCFEEATGKFLWQAIFDKLPSGLVNDWPKEGVCSTPLVEGNRLYVVTNRCTVACLDVDGFANGNQGITNEQYQTPSDADIIWELDMIKDHAVFPHNMAACSPLLVGDILFITTANGVDEGHLNIPAPQAPSFMAVDKNTGKVLWKRADPGKLIMHGQWSNASYGVVNGVKQVFFPGGDGWLYAFKPETGDLIWKCDCNPKESKYALGGTGTRNDFIGTPVFHDNKVYIGVGQDPEHFSGVGYLWCIDATKQGDVSPELGEWGKPGTPNPNSAVVWYYGGPDKRKFVPRDFIFGRTMSTVTIVDDIIYIAELQGFLHCLDAKTGKKYWQYDLKGAMWGSTFYVDGKVYVATESCDLFCFKHEKKPEVIDELDIPDATSGRDFNTKMKAKRKLVETKYLLGKSEFEAPVRSTPVVANGVMYVMTEGMLYAFEPKK